MRACETIDRLEHATWHLGQLRYVGPLVSAPGAEEGWASAWKERFHVHRAGTRTTEVAGGFDLVEALVGVLAPASRLITSYLSAYRADEVRDAFVDGTGEIEYHRVGDWGMAEGARRA